MNRNEEEKIAGFTVSEIYRFIVQFIKFAMVGVFNTGLNYMLYSTQVYLGVHYLVANAIAWGIGVFISYLLNAKFVFSVRAKGSAMIKTYIVYGISFAATSLGLIVLIDYLNVSEYIAPIIMLIFTIPFNFFAMRFWAIGKREKKLVIFDLDGTLFATDPGICSSIESVLVYNGLGKPDEDLKNKMIAGSPSYIVLKEKYNITESRLKKIVMEYRTHYQQFGIFECTPYPGIEQLIIKLKRSGFKLAIASLKTEVALLELLDNKGLGHYFDTIIGNNTECTLSKEKVMNDAISNVGFEAENTYIVGDSYMDYDASRKIGCSFIGVTYGYGFTDEEIRRLDGVTFVNDTRGIGDKLGI